ncbi:ExbD/TolR family protein [Cognatilysobacter segetis]|uniref:ExbD/TolR family protein n=1 Tax=Cognatilysobacter segetis TaxID=2492394 RepID=UPI00139028DC|nr:biopolymer transporter ExbD [Lysobacter segetis]
MAASTYAPRLQTAAMADMNVTPLVDVMLVMLVIFMITAPVLTGTLPMNLPQANPATPPAPPVQMHLRVDANGGFVLDGRAFDATALRGVLADTARRSPDAVLHVSAAADSEYQGFATALDAARASGLGNIALD